MEKVMKIGLDIHGVTDTNPFFKEMAKAMIAAGHKIHIITGASSIKAYRDLSNLDMEHQVHYHCVFSITDYLLEKGVAVTWKDPENPMFPDSEWNKAKAKYCEENDITIHFDDSEIYGLFFNTPYAQVK